MMEPSGEVADCKELVKGLGVFLAEFLYVATTCCAVYLF